MYEVEEVEVGELVQVPVRVVRMPRARFMEIVDRTLGDYPQLGRFLRPIAETMVRFPFNAWIAPVRGCGCVVGEYLVVSGEEDRRTLACSSQVSYDEGVKGLLEDRNQGDLADDFVAFGTFLDQALRTELDEDKKPQVILIED